MMMRCSGYNDYGKALNVLSIYTDMRIHSGEKVLLNVISIGKCSIFPHALENLRTHTSKKFVNIKNEGKPLMMSLTLGNI